MKCLFFIIIILLLNAKTLQINTSIDNEGI